MLRGHGKFNAETPGRNAAKHDGGVHPCAFLCDIAPLSLRCISFQSSLSHAASSRSSPAGRGNVIAAVIVALGLMACAQAGELDLAHGYYRAKQHESAAKQYADYLVKNPDGPEANEAKFFLGECYVQLRREADALPFFEAVVLAGDKDGKVLPPHRLAMAAFRIGEIHFHQREFPAAIQALARMVEDHPQSDLAGHALYLLAESQLETGQVDAAAAILGRARAVKFDEKLSVHLSLCEARLAERQGRIDDARRGFTDLAAGESANAIDAILALGLLEQKQSRYAEAAAAYRSILERPNAAATHPAHVAEAYYRLGQALYEQKDYAGARQAFQEGRTKFPRSPAAPAMAFQEALCLVQAGDWAAARPLLADFADSHPNESLAPQALHFLARCGLEQKDLALIQLTLEKLEEKYADSTWGDATRATLAEALLASEGAAHETAARLRDLLEKTKTPQHARRMRYYAAMGAYKAGDMAAVISLLADLAASPEKDRVRTDANYLLGVALAKEERWAEAIPALEVFLADDTNSPQARTALVTLAKALGTQPASQGRNKSLERLLELAAARSDAADVVLAIADTLVAKQWHAAAAGAYERAMKLGVANTASALSGLAWCEFELGRKELARQRFRELEAAADPDSDTFAEAVYMQGVLATELGGKDEAISSLRRVFQDHPKSRWSIDAGRRLARLLTAARQLEEADQVYAALVERAAGDDDHAQFTLDRAWLALDRQKTDEAEQRFRDVMNRVGSGRLAAEAALKLAELAHARADYKTAEELAGRAADLSPPETLLPAIHYRRGLAQHELGRDGEAKQSFQEVVHRFPDDPLVVACLFWLGEIEFAARKFDAAIDWFGRLLVKPGNEKYASVARLRIAHSHFQAGRLDEAAQKADELFSSSADLAARDEALYLKGRVLQQQAKFEEARAVYRQLLRGEKNESAAKAQFMIAETFFFQERFQEALDEFPKVLVYPIATWQAAALLEVAKIYERQDQPDKARSLYETIQLDYPKEPAALEAKQRIEALKTARAGR